MNTKRNTQPRRLLWLAAGWLGMLAWSAQAQTLTPKMEAVAANQEYAGLALELALYEYEGDKSYGRSATTSKVIAKRSSADADAGAQSVVPLRKLVVACVHASQSGTVTLWSQLDDQQPIKIYPNKFTQAIQGAGRIAANEEVCVGHTKEFRLRVTGNEGQLDKIYVHWAPDASAQLDQNDFPVIGRAVRATKSAATYASATVQFKVGR